MNWEPDDPAKIYRRSMIGARSMRGFKSKPNWVLAMSLFLVGSNYARAICQFAGLDPDGYEAKWETPQ